MATALGRARAAVCAAYDGANSFVRRRPARLLPGTSRTRDHRIRRLPGQGANDGGSGHENCMGHGQVQWITLHFATREDLAQNVGVRYPPTEPESETTNRQLWK